MTTSDVLPSLGLAYKDLKCLAPEKHFKLLLNRIVNGIDKIERNTRPLRKAWSRC